MKDGERLMRMPVPKVLDAYIPEVEWGPQGLPDQADLSCNRTFVYTVQQP